MAKAVGEFLGGLSSVPRRNSWSPPSFQPITKSGMFRRWWWMFPVMMALCAVLGYFTAGVVSFLMPKIYESRAVLELTPGFLEETSTEAEAARFVSVETVARACRHGDFPARWGVTFDESVAVVQDQIRISPLAEAGSVELRMRHRNAMDARDVLFAVASSYARIVEGVGEGPEESMADLLSRRDWRRLELSGLIEALPEHMQDSALEETDSDDPRLAEVQEAWREFSEASERVGRKRRAEATIGRSGFPVSDRVKIREQPLVGIAPVSPDIRFNFMVGQAAGLVVGLLLAAPAILILNARMTPERIAAMRERREARIVAQRLREREREEEEKRSIEEW